MTGTRASCCTRATRLLPPRGTITSMQSVMTAEHEARPRRGRSSARAGCALPADPRRAGPSTRQAWIAAARAHALAAAAQDRRVAGLQAQRARVRGHVGPALVDDADDAERHAHALDAQAVRARPLRDDGADRIRQRGDVLDAARHGLDARLVEREPVEQARARRCLARAASMSAAFAGKNLACVAPAVARPRHASAAILGGAAGLRRAPRSAPRPHRHRCES